MHNLYHPLTPLQLVQHLYSKCNTSTVSTTPLQLVQYPNGATLTNTQSAGAFIVHVHMW